MLKVYNTLSRTKEEFEPQDKNNVRMYVCGITPYDECHVGHARCYVVFDVIRRYLEYRGFKVNYVQNFTDIDDKIINKAREQKEVASGQLSAKDKAKEIAERYIADYFTQMDALNVRRADEYPKVTEHINEIINVVKILLDKGYAYATEQGIYFDVAKFTEYGKLSHRAKEELMPGARVEVDEKKKNPLDFALWKAAKEDEPSWDSPWGKGRPGWHIECSAMSLKDMDSSKEFILDIHGGGQDLIFPHHENEIAQSEAATEKKLAKYWMHNGFITINKEKMSKSLGNFFTIREVLQKYDPMVVRLFLLSAHYRQPMDFSDKELDAAKETYERMCTFNNNLNFVLGSMQKQLTEEEQEKLNANKAFLSGSRKEYEKMLEEAMDDDFNTPKTLGYIHELINNANISMKNTVPGSKNIMDIIYLLKYTKEQIDKWTGILGLVIKTKVSPEEFNTLVAERETARKNKDWAAADRIRKELQKKGITIEDTAFGPRLITKK